jgi:PAS domain S-box-containing protein
MTSEVELVPQEPSAPPPHAELRRVLAEIQASPQRLTELLEESGEALICFSIDRVILGVNSRAAAIFGYADGAVLIGKSSDTLVSAQLRQPDAPPLMPAKEVVQIDLPAAREDGSELMSEWAFASIDTARGHIFVSTVRDRAVSERAIDALRASEERFRLLVENVRDYSIYMLDAEGRVSSWNRGAERSKGWKTEEILGEHYELFFTPEDRAEGTPQRLLAAAEREGRQEVSGWRVRKDGTRVYVSSHLTALRSDSGELRGFATVTRDLTERLQAEEFERRLLAERTAREAAEDAQAHARESEARLLLLQQITASLTEASSAEEIANVFLDQTLAALSANGGAVYLLSPDGAQIELCAQRGHPSELRDEHDTVPLARSSPMGDAARERRAGFYSSYEDCARLYPALRAAIAIGNFEASAALPLLTRGALCGVVGIRFSHVREFSETDRAMLLTLSELCAQALERARLFSAERQARDAAETANRSKDEFLAILGHELRNPLAPIVTALHLLRQRNVEGRTVDVIDRQVGHLQRLVDDLLDVSRITRGKVELKRERIELSAIVSKAIELASPLFDERRHHLNVQVAADTLAVDVDPTRLAQVVANLLTNAAKYTEPGGHIDVQAEREGSQIVLTVRDDGMGIGAAILPRVFELFAQEQQNIDRSRGGLGLGLAIVKSLVEAHGGTVRAESAGHGQGSLFTVELPAASAIAPPAPVKRPSSPGQRVKHRVLVVDDNRDAAEMLAEMLGLKGHTAEVAFDGPTALGLAESFRPDVALLDLGLPLMDGFELARRLREQAPKLRLVALTGYGQRSDREKTKAAGFDAHLVKPVDLDLLQATLD